MIETVTNEWQAGKVRKSVIDGTLYLIASTDILLGTIDVDTIGDVGRLLFNGNQQIESAVIEA